MKLDGAAFLLKTVRFVADTTASPPSLLTTRVNEVLTLIKNGRASVSPGPDRFSKNIVNSALPLGTGNKEETFRLQCPKVSWCLSPRAKPAPRYLGCTERLE